MTNQSRRAELVELIETANKFGRLGLAKSDITFLTKMLLDSEFCGDPVRELVKKLEGWLRIEDLTKMGLINLTERELLRKIVEE